MRRGRDACRRGRPHGVRTRSHLRTKQLHESVGLTFVNGSVRSAARRLLLDCSTQVVSAENGIAPGADAGVGVGANVGQDLPAAGALFARREVRDDGDAGGVLKREGIGRRGGVGENQIRGDAHIGEIDAGQCRAGGVVVDVDDRSGLEAGADALVAALDFERAGDDAAGAADRLPLRGERGGEPGGGGLREVLKVDRASRRPGSARARLPPS